MRERNRKLINTNGDRELWQLEVRQPDGEWVTLYYGKEFVDVQGIRKQTPDDAAFHSQAEGHAWLLRGV
ncbi:hypothetical protein [Mesorhizobium sp. Cs1321R2N1]|uniref:hypothetical protein n=1 Tax=Mesorhizobium sp. Cs1321R2N1 TaxID=3015174 RepID=UPI00301BDBEF